jgi:G3E family GTPase
VAAAPIDTLLVTGFLGAGKTTLLSGWLAERPPQERWAVLVNESGALGIDRALLGGDGPDARVAVAEIAGGCACCAARVAFGATLTRLLRRGPWDRLIVETTGLGHPAELVDQLRAMSAAATGPAGRLRLRPPVAVVDASRAGLYADPTRPGHAIAADQVALARLVVLNRTAGLDADALAALAQLLGGLPPWPRPVLPTATGRVPLARVLAALEDVAAMQGPEAARPVPQPSPTASDDAVPLAGVLRGPGVFAPRTRPAAAAPVRSAARRWSPDTVFDRPALQAALEAMVAPDGPLRGGGLLRGKGVFRTERAWYGWQWVDGRVDWQESAWRADSRVELLANGSIDAQVVDIALRAAVSKG